ncbi:MAG: 1-deoxy-D-xylulose-5-phosphate reductoisomerase [Marinifilaceae bacterium]|jgi:1-deoxy-D-xylulose-5-phosphate reductoisomerase|nr:1-deoxy-D-xylulose-5-phosphate reductoisomerase [Marinifilaceae bacterium]
MTKKNIAILGSTGSIGTQALDIVEKTADKFTVSVLTANNNIDLLIEQAIQFKPKTVVIANENKYAQLKTALASYDIDIKSGSQALCEVVEYPEIDIVLTAMVGYSGLLPTISAIKAKKDIALANKETLVVAGEIVMDLAKKNNVAILPVDSEHSAIFQCLTGECHSDIEKIYLTASGGPFRGKDLDFLSKAKACDALKHPNWDMGNKISIDSASLMNKGFEAIEAKWLFNLQPNQIDVIVHKQSIIHSLVQFSDSSIKAQMGLPDMRLPIIYAFSYPNRMDCQLERFNFMDYPELNFEKANTDLFRNLDLAYHAMDKGGNMPCILNAANEVVVDAFLKDKIAFLEMSDIIEQCMTKFDFVKEAKLEDYIVTDREVRLMAKSMIASKFLVK